MNRSIAVDHAAANVLVALPLAICVCCLCGCSQTPAPARPPKIDSTQSAARALELYDKNHDGQLDAAELAAAPGLLKALRVYDRDGDRKISAAEIATRIAQWQQDNTGLVVLNCLVVVDGLALEGAKVRLVPEPFLGDDIHPAEATTRTGGVGSLKIADDDLPSHLRGIRGVAMGVYKVEVTHPTTSLPAKYNRQTELGLELGPNSLELSSGRLVLSLNSRP